MTSMNFARLGLAVIAVWALGCGPQIGLLALDQLQTTGIVYSPVHERYPLEERERYAPVDENSVKLVAESPVSTFSVDVDTGSYSNSRRMLESGRIPPADAVRTEEFINYFSYDYPQPTGEQPFSVTTTTTAAPWNPERALLFIGIQGMDVAKDSLPPANLVFLIDVSGSMSTPDKLPLVKSSLKLLVNELREQDRVSIVTYAGAVRVALPPTPGAAKGEIIAAIEGLSSWGGTAGASGIQLAYAAAQQAFIPNGINRILLATDGDFNVGVSDVRQLESLVAEKRKSGIGLSTLGFGTGNYNDALMERLADAGDGAYSYIDRLSESHRVLVNEMTSTLATIARDVKVQIEFNPELVQEYRLIGYENRILAREDFNNDNVDAGDIGSGHSVTAIYELTLAGRRRSIDPLRYATGAGRNQRTARSGELAHLRLRYKQPGKNVSELIEHAIVTGKPWPAMAIEDAPADFQFAAAVAGFGQLLRGGKHTGSFSYSDVRRLAASATGTDPFGYRSEFLGLVSLAESLSTRSAAAEDAGRTSSALVPSSARIQ